jgi:hypothetical protein
MPKNGNITGQPFDPEVVDQINARQAFLGVQYKEDKHLIYQNNKTAFLRLASSVNIEDTPTLTAKEILDLRGIPESSKGSKLAQQCVLFGGVVSVNNESTSPTKPFGLVNSSNIQDIFSGAYGWGGIKSRGYVPMPGIESANIGFYNRGALAKADVKIKVYSVEQLQIFDLLYFRIGYTMLLEWGHSLYIDNNQTLKNRDDFYTKPFKAFFEKSTQNNILDSIKEERKLSSYNYDAMLGKVTNFTWKFNADGSYDIDLKLVGLGDVIEALKINTSLAGAETTISNTTQLQNEDNSINKRINALNSSVTSQDAINGLSFFPGVPTSPEEASSLDRDWKAFKSTVDRFITQYSTNLTSLYASAERIGAGRVEDAQIKLNISEAVAKDISVYLGVNYINKGGGSKIVYWWEGKIKEAKSLYAAKAGNASRTEAEGIAPQVARENKGKTDFNKQLYTWIESLQKKTADTKNLCSIPFKAKSANSSNTGTTTLGITQYYVRLGHVLEWIQDNLLIYDFKDGAKNPYLTIDTEIETNLCLRFPYQVSADPLVCIIPTENLDKNKKGWQYFNGSKSKIDLRSYFVEENPYVGKVMNIFVNIDFIARTINEGVDANGRANLLTFLKSTLVGINDALGNVNKLDAVYDAETNQIKIIEGSRLNKISEGTDIGVFEIYGVKLGSKGSFVTNVDFQVQLPPNMAAMATISAQSTGNIVGENATALSRLNTGLQDRIITTKLDVATLGGIQKGSKTDPEVLFQTNIANLSNGLKTLYKDLTYQKDNVDVLKSINRDIASYTVGYAAEKNQLPAPFFIPFNLSLDMDGLSGMRNYERFAVSEEVLPYSYRTSNGDGVIDFLIKGISHNVANNQWTTKIESLTVSSKRKGITENLDPDFSFLGDTNNDF